MDTLTITGPEARDGAYHIQLAGEINCSNNSIASLHETVKGVPPRSKIIFDLSQVTYINSLGINFFVRLHNRKYDITILRPGPLVEDVIRITHLHKVIKIVQ